jgi:FKBP-type peptidyl-prolyl cis-trans isomerase 2
MTIQAGDRVRFEYTGRLLDGTVFDTSRESIAEESGLANDFPDRDYDPLTVEVGSERLVEGLDEAMVGMTEGESKTVTVPPDKAYGEHRADNVAEFELDVFGDALQREDPEEGMHVQTQQGMIGEVIEIEGGIVTVDFNHELAGETIEFDIEIIEIEE